MQNAQLYPESCAFCMITYPKLIQNMMIHISSIAEHQIETAAIILKKEEAETAAEEEQ